MKKFIESPAKVNIGLWVLNKRPDGYHDILTLFHTISLKDKIYIEPSVKLSVTTTNPKIPENEGNIVYKALKKFEEWTGIEPKYRIFIEKNIPVGAGLGGGSSNAAAVLKAVNQMERNVLTDKELMELGKTVGADVPFFIKGGFAKGEGIGDKLTFLNKTFTENLFIVYPGIEVSTKDVYSLVDEKSLTKKEEIPIIDSLLEDVGLLLENIENTLGDIAKEKYPVINEVVNTLEFLGFFPYISGSGSSVFALGEPNEELKKICRIKGWRLIETAFE